MTAATTAAYRDTNVLRWAAAYTASVTGDIVYFLALSWAVTRTAGPAQAGAVLAAGAVPRAVLMLGGGVVADRFGARRVVVVSDAVRCAVILGVAVAVYAAGAELWLLYVLAVVFGTVDALFMPAVGALPPQIAPHDQLTRVQGMRALAVRLSNAVGPLTAGVVLGIGGPSAAFAGAGLLFGGSLVLLLAVRIQPLPAREGPRASAGEDLRDGLRYLRRERRLTRLVIVIGLGEMCFSGPVAAGLVMLTDERHWGAGVLAAILAAFSVGGAVSALALTAADRIPYAGATLTTGLVVTAAVTAAIGRIPSPGTAVALGALMGLASGAAMVIGNALLQKETDPHYLGRVSSVTGLCTLGLSPLLFPLAGLVAATWGAAAFFAGCGVVCLAAAGVGLSVRTLRTARL
ncbi:MFS transporter [Streptomyces beijiangensis]|uniref:MFS transporter n=1 Tax=Streptomyces beijiangensis TaxID=163361 RepID=A0A939JMB9_9ACTN|nr:MFS transporter [Streptomyces beijiangensis]MBO0517757.1 MFS transporter [Streptomyces beijiangensis]